MSEELKPCPFCGGIGYMSKSYDHDGSGVFFSIQCRKCRAKSPEFYAVETCPIFFGQVRDEWNTRPTPSELDALRAEKMELVAQLATAREAALREAADAIWNGPRREYGRGADGVSLQAAHACRDTVLALIDQPSQEADNG